MQVLEHHHVGAARGAPLEQEVRGGGDRVLAPPRVHREHARITGVDGQEVAQERERGSRSSPSRRTPRSSLATTTAFGIRVLDAEHAPQHVDHRMQRHRAAEGHRLALDPRGVPAEPPAQLLQQPRLADAGLADDQHDLALPAPREREALAEEAQLALAADEASPARLRAAGDLDGAGLAAARRERKRLEAAGEEPAGGGARDHRAGRGPRDERGERLAARGPPASPSTRPSAVTATAPVWSATFTRGTSAARSRARSPSVRTASAA